MPYGAKAAVKSSLFPPFSGQKLTLDEMIKGYCFNDISRGKLCLISKTMKYLT